jgi:hypothetical protein
LASAQVLDCVTIILPVYLGSLPVGKLLEPCDCAYFLLGGKSKPLSGNWNFRELLRFFLV